MNYKKEIKKYTVRLLFIIIKPFIIPILTLLILFFLISSITDILYIAFNHEDQVNLKEEISYYEKEYDREEMKGFFSSVWDFVNKIFGGGEITEDTDWPVVRTLFNIKSIWIKKSTNIWSIDNA